MKLYEVAKLIRAKNAGPFMLTIDILFESQKKFEAVCASHVLTKELIGDLFHTPAEEVQYYESPLAMAIKFSIPRPTTVGDFHDTDIFGGQFHAPLVNIEIPDRVMV